MLVLGQAWFGVAESLLSLKHIPECIQARQKSIDVFRDLLARYPDDVEGRRFFSTSEKRLAHTYITELHDPAKGMEHLMIAQRIDRERVTRDPSNAVARLDLALGESYLFGAMRRKGDLPAARHFLESAISLRSEVLAADPRNARVRFFLISDYTRLGVLLRDQHQPSESRSAFQKGLQLVSEAPAGALDTPDVRTAVEDLRRESQ